MRISVKGSCSSAAAVRTALEHAGLSVSDFLPSFVVEIHEEDVPCPVVDGIDSELERHVVTAIADRSPSGKVVLHRQGGVQSDRALRVVTPVSEKEKHAVESGIVHGLLKAIRRRG